VVVFVIARSSLGEHSVDNPAANRCGCQRSGPAGPSPAESARSRRSSYTAELVLAADGWDSHPRRVGVNGRVLLLGYFASQPTDLFTALCANGYLVDLLVVTPNTASGAADAAMVLTDTTSNLVYAQHILLTVNAPHPRSAEGAVEAVWDAKRPAGSHPASGRARGAPSGTGRVGAPANLSARVRPRAPDAAAPGCRAGPAGRALPYMTDGELTTAAGRKRDDRTGIDRPAGGGH